MEEDWRQKYPSLPLFPSFLFFFYLSYLPLFSFPSLFLLSFLPIFLSFLLTVHIKHHGNGTNQHVICQHLSTVVWHCFWKMPFKSDNLERMNEWEFRIFLERLWNWTYTCWSWKRLLWIPQYDEGASAPELIVWLSHQKKTTRLLRMVSELTFVHFTAKFSCGASVDGLHPFHWQWSTFPRCSHC